MLKKILISFLLAILIIPCSFAKGKDTRSKELKYQYEVLKQDEKAKMEGKIFNLVPSGYMTVDEYEAMSEYKDKSNMQFDIPKFQGQK